MMRFLVEMTETVDKPAFHKTIQPGAFLRQKTGYFCVADRIVNINRLVTNVVIATNNQVRDFFFQLVDILLKIVHVLKLMTQTIHIGARRQVQTHHGKSIKINAQVTAFFIHIVDAGAVHHIFRSHFRENGHPAVTFLFRRKIVLIRVARRLNFHHRNLFVQRFNFLKANNIRTRTLQPF